MYALKLIFSNSRSVKQGSDNSKGLRNDKKIYLFF